MNSPSTAGASAVCFNLLVNAGALLTIVPGSDVGVGNGVTVNGSSRGNGAIRPTGATPGGGISGSGIFGNVVVQKTGGADFFVVGGVTVAGSFTLDSGVLKVGVGSAALLVQGSATFNSGSVIAGLTNGTIDVRGNVAFAGSAYSGDVPLTCGGNLTVGPGFVPSAGSITLNGTGTQVIAAVTPLTAAPFHGLVIAAGSAATTGSNLQFSGPVVIAGVLFLTGGASLTSLGSFSVSAAGSLNLGSATHVFGNGLAFGGVGLAATGSFHFNGPGTVSSSLPLPSVLFSAGSITLNGPLSIAGNMNVTGATVTLQNGNLTVNGTPTVTSGCFTTAGTSALVATGPLSPGPTCGPVNYVVLGNWTSGPGYQPTSGKTTFAANGSQTITAPGSVFNEVEIGTTSLSDAQSELHTASQATVNGSLSMNGNALQVDGDFILGPSGSLNLGLLDGNVDHHFKGNFTATANGSQVGTIVGAGFMVFDGTGQQTVNSAAVFPNLRVAGSASGASVRTTGTLVISGTLEQQSGALDVDGPMFTVSGDAVMQGGSLPNSGNTLDVRGNVTFSGTVATAPPEIRCGGDWNSDANFSPLSRTVRFDGTGPQTISAAAGGFAGLTVASGAQVTTMIETTVRGSLTVTGTLHAAGTGRLDVNVDATISAGGALNIGAMDSTFAGGFACAGAVTGTGHLVFDGTSINVSSTTTVPPIRVDGVSFRTQTLHTAGFSLVNGAFDPGPIHVTGNATFTGGVFVGGGTIDVDGDITFAGTPTTYVGSFNCGGNWTSGPSFQPPAGLGTVRLDGSTPQSITMSGGAFSNLMILPGSQAVAASTVTIGGGGTLDVRGSMTFPPGTHLDCNGVTGVTASGTLDIGPDDATFAGDVGNSGVITGNGTMVFDGSSVLTSTSPLPSVRATGTLLRIGNVTISGGLSLQAGILEQAGTIQVYGNASLLGGTLDGSNGILDVDGDLTSAGTSATGNQSIFCAGDFAADLLFAPVSGQVILDGTVPTTISALAPGMSVTFAALRLRFGERSSVGSCTINLGSLLIDSSARLRIPGGSVLTVPSGTLTVNGTLDVDAGGQLALGAGVAATISQPFFGPGVLELVGTPSSPAAITGAGSGGYSLVVQGNVRASNFLIEKMGPGGVVLDAWTTFAPAPDDFRAGTFSFPSSAAGSRLLDLSLSSPRTLHYLAFLDPLLVGTHNVRQNGAPVTMVNWGGAFGGGAFESDLSNNLTWAPPQITVVSFTAVGGPGSVSLSWTTTTEVDVAEFLVERSASPTGPFSQVTQVAAAGPSNYQFVDTPLTAGQTVFYRLRERLTHGSLVTLAAAAATPLPTQPAPSILTVGPGGTHATIQAAVAAATSPITTILVEPGTYPAFTVNTGVPGTMRIIGARSGAVAVSTAGGSVQILNLPLGHNVEISDLAIGNAGTAGPGLVISGCLGVVVVDESSVAAAPGVPGVGILGSTSVAIQKSSMTGGPGLLLDLGSVAVASKGSLSSVTLQGLSSLRLVELNPSSTVQPGSTLTTFSGVMPDLGYPDFLPFGVPFSGTVTAGPGNPWFLLASPNVAWNDFAPFIEMVGLIDLTNYLMLQQGVTDALGNAQTLTLELPPGATAINGVPFALQLLVYDPVSGIFRISNLASTQGLM